MPTISDILQLSKIRLNVSVVFSAIAGYFIAPGAFDSFVFLYLVLGGLLVVGASNGFNQILEKDYDAIMERTKDRPLPSGRMSVKTAFYISLLMGVLGVFMLYRINFLSGFFGTLSILLYVLVYTPLKRKTSISVLVGAIPGAIPFMLGWVARTNDFDIESGYLFAVQFLWQFPHFWAIAWVCDEDYKRAGFKMLPGGKDVMTAGKTMLYTLFLIPLSILPYFGIIGSLSLNLVSMILLVLLGAWFFWKAYILYKSTEDADARKLMFASFIYLTILQFIYMFN
jgi:protoheme IX farnesyltransferase